MRMSDWSSDVCSSDLGRRARPWLHLQRHPAAAAVARETLKIYEERDILGHIASVSGRLQDGMRRFANHPLVGEVRGVGLIGAIELVKDKATRESFDGNGRASCRDRVCQDV